METAIVERVKSKECFKGVIQSPQNKQSVVLGAQMHIFSEHNRNESLSRKALKEPIRTVASSLPRDPLPLKLFSSNPVSTDFSMYSELQPAPRSTNSVATDQTPYPGVPQTVVRLGYARSSDNPRG